MGQKEKSRNVRQMPKAGRGEDSQIGPPRHPTGGFFENNVCAPF
jgi:hypothetical protein